MSASRYTNKIRTTTESNEQKVQQPGRVANFLPMLPANGCSADYTQINYVIPCPCDAVLPTNIISLMPLLLNSDSRSFYSPSLIFAKTYYFILSSSANVMIKSSRNARVVCVGAGGLTFNSNGGGAGQIQTSTSITNDIPYSILISSTVSFGSIVAIAGQMSGGVNPETNGRNNAIGYGAGGNAGFTIGGLPPTNVNAQSGVGYGAGGGGATINFFEGGGGGDGGFNPDLYFGVSGLNGGMPQSTITTNGSPGIVILALQ